MICLQHMPIPLTLEVQYFQGLPKFGKVFGHMSKNSEHIMHESPTI